MQLKSNSKGNDTFEKVLVKVLFICSRRAVINYTNYIIIWLLSLITALLAKSSKQQTFPQYCLHCFLYSSLAPTHFQIINSVRWQQSFSWVFVQYKSLSWLFYAFSPNIMITWCPCLDVNSLVSVIFIFFSMTEITWKTPLHPINHSYIHATLTYVPVHIWNRVPFKQFTGVNYLCVHIHKFYYHFHEYVIQPSFKSFLLLFVINLLLLTYCSEV